MSTLPRRASSLGIYHVVIRGVNKQRIFEDAEDYQKFLKVLRKYQPICGYKILAYCLMTNHIHLLIQPGEIGLAQIFQRIGPSFVNWYNIKYQRVGHLFQSRFRSKPVNNIAYLLTVIRYIHQNPVKAEICEDPSEYEYSSFRNYFDNNLIDGELVLSMVSEEYFYSYNHMENNDKCMDIDEEKPRVLTEEIAIGIMLDVSGCGSVAEFQALEPELRDEALREMRQDGVSIKQMNRITGISIGALKKALTQDDLHQG